MYPNNNSNTADQPSYPPAGYGYSPHSTEPYGQVASQLAQRKSYVSPMQASSPPATTIAAAPSSYGMYAAAPASPYGGYNTIASPPSATGTSAGAPDPLRQAKNKYKYNVPVACFIVPVSIGVFMKLESMVPTCMLFMLLLSLYALDLANLREATFFLIWTSAFLMTFCVMWFSLVESTDDGPVLTTIFASSNAALLFIATASWTVLQFQWCTTENQTLARSFERLLHGLVPPIAAALGSSQLVDVASEEYGNDVGGIAAPFLFALLMTAGMLILGSCTSSFDSKNTANGTNGTATDKTTKNAVAFILPKSHAFGHSVLLLIVPTAMHLASSLRRILSSYASTDDLYDLCLAVTIPYCLHLAISTLHRNGVVPSPYGSNMLFPNAAGSTLRGILVPLVVSVVGSLALQQRYLIPICHSFSYHFMGAKSPVWLLTLYWTAATVSLLGAFWLWGRQSSETGNPLFGDYHEDVVQLLLALAGMALGKAFGLPWNFTPLPILGFLGLSLWLSTRMLRYLAIFLFVIHATGLVVFTYRFAGITEELELPLPGVKLGLVRFGLSVVLCSVLIGLVAGLVARPSGGFASSFLKKVDATGLLLIVYTCLLTVLEITVLKRPIPAAELSGVIAEGDKGGDEQMLYNPSWAILTSSILCGIAVFGKRARLLAPGSAWCVVSLACGKAIAILIDEAESSNGEPMSGVSVLVRALLASVVCLVTFIPRVILKPIHVKAQRRHGKSSGMSPELPAGTVRTIMFYAFVILPLAIIAAIPYVLFPLAGILAGSYGSETFYAASQPVFQLIGCAIALWGLACLAMMNYYLPDGGGEVWKKLSALSFLTGVGIYFASPSVGYSVSAAESNPYASLSSLGSQILSRSKSRTGGWGLLSACLATLLAITGPLALKERRNPTGKKDKFLLLRTMIFSLMFGGGVSWFITVVSMTEADWLVLIVTVIACLTLSFLGTIAAVLGYFLELEHFDEVEQLGKTWLIAFPILLPFSGLPSLVGLAENVPAFGSGGWLSTFLLVGTMVSLAFTVALRSRQAKDERTKAAANFSCIVAWVCAVSLLYGRFGVAGLDADLGLTTVLGMSASTFGTFGVSCILLALEGPSSGHSRSRVPRLSVAKASPGISSSGLSLPNLKRSTRWVPLVVGPATVFILATLYCILLRGSELFTFMGVSVIAPQRGIIAKMLGMAKKASTDQGLAALAQKAVSHSQALRLSTKLAGTSIWTARSIFGPLLYLGGVVATLPTLVLFVRGFWSGIPVAAFQVAAATPLNLIPLVLSRGIPTLNAGALLGLCMGLYQLLVRRQSEHQSKMRI